MKREIAYTTDKGARTRERILDAALPLFAVRGFHGVSLDDVATGAGLGKAGLLHHFPSKERLYDEILSVVAAQLEQRMNQAIKRAKSPRARFSAFIRVQAAWMAEEPDQARLILRELLDNAERLGDAHRLPLLNIVSAFKAEVVAAQRAGLLRPGSAMAMVTVYLGALSYAFIVQPTFKKMNLLPASASSPGDWLQSVAAAAINSTIGRP
jgi:AcrR family transcriptional regulator